ncbi:MAG: WhiB family transcriptional regulator [Pseudonocardiaceae bacterium]
MEIRAQVDAGDWQSRGACRTLHPDRLFVQGAAQHKAKVVCQPCPVRAQCLAEALDRRIEFGVWGGMTERERRALLRRRTDVSSWAELLAGAARKHDSVGQQSIPVG